MGIVFRAEDLLKDPLRPPVLDDLEKQRRVAAALSTMGVTTATTHKQPGGASVTVGPVRPIATTYGEAARLSQTGVTNALRVNQAAERGGEEAQRKVAAALATYRIEDGEPSLPGAMVNSALGGMVPSRRMAEAGRAGAVEQFTAEGGRADQRRFDMRWGPYRKAVTNQDLIRGAGYAGEFVGAGVYGGPVGRTLAPVGGRIAAKVGGYAGELAASAVENAVGNAALGFAEGATVGVDERGGSLRTGLTTAAQDAAVGAVAGPVLKGAAEGGAMLAREGMGAVTRGLAKVGQKSATVTDNLRALSREADLGDPIPQLPAGEMAVGFPSLRHLVRTKQATVREGADGRWLITFKGDQPLLLTARATDDTFFIDWLGPGDVGNVREMSPKQIIKAIAAIKSLAKDTKAKYVASQPINESVMRHMALHGAKWEPPPPDDWEMLPVLVAPAENIITGRKAYANFVDMQQRDPELWATLTTDPHAQEQAFPAYNQKHGMDPFGRLHDLLEREYGRAVPGEDDLDTPIGMDEDFDFDAYSGLPWEAAKRQWQKLKARLGARGDADPKYRAQDDLARLMTRAANQSARFTMDYGKATVFDMAAVLTGDPNFIAAYSIAANRDLFKLIRAAEWGLARAEEQGLVPKGSWRNMQALLDAATGKSLALRGRPSVADDMKTTLGGDIPTKGVFRDAGRSLLRIGEAQRAGFDEGALSSYAGIPWNELMEQLRALAKAIREGIAPGANNSGTKRLVNRARQQARQLYKEAERLRKKGQDDAARQAQDRADRLIGEIARVQDPTLPPDDSTLPKEMSEGEYRAHMDALNKQSPPAAKSFEEAQRKPETNELRKAWQQFSERFKKSSRPAPKDRDAMLRDGQNLRGLLVDRLHEVQAEFERIYDGDSGDSKNANARLDALHREQNELYEALDDLENRLTDLRYSGSQREAQFRHDADEMLTRAVEEEQRRKGEPIDDPVPEQYDRGDDFTVDDELEMLYSERMSELERTLGSREAAIREMRDWMDQIDRLEAEGVDAARARKLARMAEQNMAHGDPVVRQAAKFYHEHWTRRAREQDVIEGVPTPDGRARPAMPDDPKALQDAADIEQKRDYYRGEIEQSKARVESLRERELRAGEEETDDILSMIEQEEEFQRQMQAEIDNIGKPFGPSNIRPSQIPGTGYPMFEKNMAKGLADAFGEPFPPPRHPSEKLPYDNPRGPVREGEVNLEELRNRVLGGLNPIVPATPERMFGKSRKLDPARLNAGFPLDEMTKLGVDAIRSGKRKLVEWRKAVESKAGKPFETWKAARTAHAEAMAAHRALYNRKVVNTSKLEADLDPTGAEYVRRKVADVGGADLQKSLKMTAEEMRAEVDKAVERLSNEPDIFDVDKARSAGGAEVRARLEKFLANGKRTEAISERLQKLSETDPAYRELQEEFAQLEAQSEALIANYIVGASQKGRDLAYQRWQSTALKRSPDYWVTKAKIKARAAEVPWTSDLETEMRALAEKFGGAKDRQEQRQLAGQMNALMGQIGQRGIGMQLVDLLKTAMTFPGPIDVANFASNSVAQTMTAASDHYAATIDWMLSAVYAAAGKHRRRLRTAPFKLGSQQDEAVGRGLRQGVANAITGMKYGTDPDFGGKFGSVGKFDLIARARKQLGKPPENVADAAVNAFLKYHWNRFGAADAGFRFFAYEQYLLQEARRMAVNEGLKGRRARDRVDQLMAKPPADIAIAAVERARYVTFTDDNKLADIVTRVKSMAPVGFKEALHTFIPFVKTVANVVDFSALRHTPVVDLGRTLTTNALERRRMGRRHTAERVTAEIAGGDAGELASKHAAERAVVGERLDQRLIDSLGRQATGASLMALGAYLRSRGLITGSGPRTAQERDTYEARGQSAYAMRDAQGNWINYHRLAGPVAPMLALGADLYDYATTRYGVEQVGMTEKEKAYRYVARPMIGAAVEGAPGGHFTIFGRAVSSEPEMQALSNPAVAATSPGKTWARAFDPFERRTEGVADRMKANIPGLRQTLPVKRDAAGRAIPNIERGLDAFVGTGRREAVDNPVFEEMARLGVPFSRPGAVDTYTPQQQRIRRRRGETDKRLPEEYRRSEAERDEMAAQQGPEIMRRLDRLFRSSGYRRLPDEMKRRRVESVLTSVRQREDERRSRQLLRRGVVPEDSK